LSLSNLIAKRERPYLRNPSKTQTIPSLEPQRNLRTTLRSLSRFSIAAIFPTVPITAIRELYFLMAHPPDYQTPLPEKPTFRPKPSNPQKISQAFIPTAQSNRPTLDNLPKDTRRLNFCRHIRAPLRWLLSVTNSLQSSAKWVSSSDNPKPR
jgi:hypothetical protein